MADQLNMNGLNLGPDGQQGGAPGGRSYIPPHMRNRPQGGPPQAAPQSAPPMNGPGPGVGPAAGGPLPGGAPAGAGGPPTNGLGNSNWSE
jgi:ATP-dependent RNA helicase DDX3X